MSRSSAAALAAIGLDAKPVIRDIAKLLNSEIPRERYLEMAVKQRFPEAGLVAHSDRGSQYASEHYRRALAAGHRVQYEPPGELL